MLSFSPEEHLKSQAFKTILRQKERFQKEKDAWGNKELKDRKACKTSNFRLKITFYLIFLLTTGALHVSKKIII